MNKKHVIALIIAVLVDIVDYGVGWIPIAGDLLDILGIVLLLPLIGKYALIPVIEFIPFVDFVPTFTIAVILAIKMKGKRGDKWI